MAQHECERFFTRFVLQGASWGRNNTTYAYSVSFTQCINLTYTPEISTYECIHGTRRYNQSECYGSNPQLLSMKVKLMYCERETRFMSGPHAFLESAVTWHPHKYLWETTWYIMGCTQYKYPVHPQKSEGKGKVCKAESLIYMYKRDMQCQKIGLYVGVADTAVPTPTPSFCRFSTSL